MQLAIGMLIASLMVTAFFRRTPLHPCFWLPPIFALYGTWYSLGEFVRYGVSYQTLEKVLLLNTLALLCALAGIATAVRLASTFSRKRRNIDVTIARREIGPFFVLVAACAYSLAYVLGSGVSSKREIVDEILREIPLISAVWSVFTVLAVRQILLFQRASAEGLTRVCIVVLLAVLAWLILGERNFVFGFGLVLILISLAKRPGLRAFSLYGLAIAFLVLAIPVTQAFKSVLVGESRPMLQAVDDLFGGELAAPGRNLAIVLDYPAGLNGKDVLTREVARAFSLGLSGTAQESISRWYNRDFRPAVGLGGSSGWGFTLVGAGWLVGEEGGVAGYFLFYGFVIGLLYALSSRSFFWMSVYMIMVPMCLYVIRQDMAYFLGALLKHAMLPVLLLTAFHSVIRAAGRRSQATGWAQKGTA